MLEHGKAIIDKQFLQERMANAAIDIFLATAVLSRTTWEIERAGSVDAAKNAGRLRARVRADGLSARSPQHPRAPSQSGRRLKSIAELSLRRETLGPRRRCSYAAGEAHRRMDRVANPDWQRVCARRSAGPETDKDIASLVPLSFPRDPHSPSSL